MIVLLQESCNRIACRLQWQFSADFSRVRWQDYADSIFTDDRFVSLKSLLRARINLRKFQLVNFHFQFESALYI